MECARTGDIRQLGVLDRIMGYSLSCWIPGAAETGVAMNGADGPSEVVTARLPSGVPVRVALAGPDAADGMSSVGLRDLDLNGALETVGEICSTVVDKLKAARPTRRP